MSDVIDWSKAPEVTIGRGEIGIAGFYVWFSDKWYEYVDRNNGGRYDLGGPGACKKKDIANVIARPQPTPWSGEGLPPVGTVCEYRVCDGTWYKCEIRYTIKHPDGGVVAYCPHLDHEQVLYAPYCTFRPIRTLAQIAEDEREAYVTKMVSVLPITILSPTDACGLLYDAGLRFTDK